MKKYIVEIPISGAISVEIEVSSKEEALAEAWEKYNEGWEKYFELYWEAQSKLFDGNVSHVYLNSQDATEVD
jgi:hypothetical protein